MNRTVPWDIIRSSDAGLVLFNGLGHDILFLNLFEGRIEPEALVTPVTQQRAEEEERGGAEGQGQIAMRAELHNQQAARNEAKQNQGFKPAGDQSLHCNIQQLLRIGM